MLQVPRSRNKPHCRWFLRENAEGDILCEKVKGKFKFYVKVSKKEGGN